MLTDRQRSLLENAADTIEAVARSEEGRDHMDTMNRLVYNEPRDLAQLAWRLKRIARFGTPSYGM